MNFLKLLFELFVIYLVYKLIFDFIIPIYKTTKQVKHKMDEMHQRMQETRHQTVDEESTNNGSAVPRKPSAEDYIDYEEIKSPLP